MAEKKKKKRGVKVNRADGVIPITLGGETRSVKVLSIRDSAAFRGKASALFEPLAEIVLKLRHSVEPKKAVVALGPDATAKDKKAAAEKAASELGLGMLPKIMPWLLGDGLVRLVELPYQYAPELEELRESATDVEEIKAGSVVLSLFLPLFMTLLMELPTMLSALEDDTK